MKRAFTIALFATCALAPLQAQGQQFNGASFGLSYTADRISGPTFSTVQGFASVELGFSDSFALQADLHGSNTRDALFPNNEQGLDLSLIFRPSETVTLALTGGLSRSVWDTGAATESHMRNISFGLRARLTPSGGPLSFELHARRSIPTVLSGPIIAWPVSQYGLIGEYAFSDNLSVSLGFEGAQAAGFVSQNAVLGARYSFDNGFAVAADMRAFTGAGGGTDFRLSLTKAIGGGVSFAPWRND